MSKFGKINQAYDPDQPLPKPKPMAWYDKARCRHLSPEKAMETFYPERNGEGAKEHGNYAEAKKYCRTCPVKADCLEVAIVEETHRNYGYRGDATPAERHAMWRIRYDERLRQQRLAKCKNQARETNDG
jgi:hypothetical protein